MKDFIKWLGNNEKVGKVIVWLLIIIIALIILNTTLMSLGLPHYQITYKSLTQISSTKSLDFVISVVVAALNFISVLLLVFRIKDIKAILLVTIPYLVLNYIIYHTCNYVIFQLYIIIFSCIFCYFYSNKKPKYIFYYIIAFVIAAIVQGIWYTLKVQFIDYDKLNYLTKSILTLDYFIIMGIIILVREIYLRKRGVKNGLYSMDRTIQQRKDICKETSKKSIKPSKITNKEVVSTKK